MTGKELVHESVLKKEVLNSLISPETRSVFDGTLGLGGHAEQILSAFPELECYIGVDLDAQHLAFAQKRLSFWEKKTFFFNQNYSTIAQIVQEVDPARPMVILLDLGVCSNQLDDAEKGFSFRSDGPLNMSFGEENKGACEALLNNAPMEELRRIFREYGEEPSAHRISKKIIEHRAHASLRTTGELREIIEKSVHPKDLKKSLMRVFQALRIATNDELGHLEKVMGDSLTIMRSGDRLGIMSFHSLEDRLVKNFFKKHSRPVTKATNFSLHEVVAPADLRLLTKKPLVPTEEEQGENPRARSVKFRIVEKI